MVCGLMYSCLVYLWNEQKSVSRHEQKFGHAINCTFFLQSSKDLTRKFAELGLSCKLPLEKKKKSLEDAPNCDIMPLSQNNTEWSSHLVLTSWIRVLNLIASYCHRHWPTVERNYPTILSQFKQYVKVFTLCFIQLKDILQINWVH